MADGLPLQWHPNYFQMNNTGKAFFSIVALACAACSPKADNVQKESITVSIEPERQLLEYLAGDRYEIVTMLSRGSDPETFDPSMSLRRKADGSKAYFAIGAFPFEDNIHESLPGDVAYFDVSEGVEHLYGTHGHSHGKHSHTHEEADPHIWTSVANMKIIAANMTLALCGLDTSNCEVYKGRLEALENRLDSIDSYIRSVVPKGSSFAVWHPSLSYFARDYGLNQIAVGHESKEMPAARLKAVIDSARSRNVKILFFQKEYDIRQTQSLNGAIGSRLVEIDPLAYDWDTELTRIADELARP